MAGPGPAGRARPREPVVNFVAELTDVAHTGPAHASYAEIPFIGDEPGL